MSKLRKFQLRVNGKKHNINVDADTPLLWVLRDELGLKGTKYGCGVSQCGACTVHLDGRAVRSCVTDVSVAALSEVTTIEGLSTDAGRRVQEAWRDIKVPQCGYCQPGQIMSASALLDDNAKPSDDDIDRAMSLNICRCGTYKRIRAAIHQAAEGSSS